MPGLTPSDYNNFVPFVRIVSENLHLRSIIHSQKGEEDAIRITIIFEKVSANTMAQY